jgi:hypothetical protein
MTGRSGSPDTLMITYNLVCSQGHEFEGWFKDSAAFDAQAESQALSCPLCGDAEIKKAIMAPAVKTSVTKKKGHSEPTPQQVRQFMSGYRKFVEENADYVGPKFPEEARKIHYGETEERHIYGEATASEVKDLVEEGVDIAPLPPDPDEMN